MDDEEEIETIEKKEIVTTKIEKFKKGNKIMTLTTRTVKQMDANTTPVYNQLKEVCTRMNWI